jgi:hypothetical protein
MKAIGHTLPGRLPYRRCPMALLLWTSSSQVGVGQVHHDFDWQRRGRGMVWQQRFVSSSPVSSAGVANGAACEAYTRLYESGKFQFDKNQFSLLKTLMKIEYNMHAILAGVRFAGRLFLPENNLAPYSPNLSALDQQA